jgi:uncharacterized protein
VRIAVVGTGIAGLTAAYTLRDQHTVELFEKNDWAGGHSHTIPYDENGRELDLDTGFLVHNPLNYPHLIKFFEALGIRTQESEMSFSSRCHRCDIEYRGSGLDSFFAQRKNLFNMAHIGMLQDILRFMREAEDLLGDPRFAKATLAEWVAEKRFGLAFRDHFLLPFCAAIWSAPPGEAGDLPARFTVQFFKNHMLLGRYGAPTWRSMTGGSRRYVAAVTALFGERVHLQRPVTGVRREGGGVVLTDHAGRELAYDAVVIAAHADEALAMLQDPTPRERHLLGRFGYTENETVLHWDEDALPKIKKVRAAWNYELEDCKADEPHVSVTYSLNILQRLQTQREYSVTLNRKRPIDPSKVIGRWTYHHPKFTIEAMEAQRSLKELNQGRTAFAGSYFRWGFHEDAHVAGLDAARALRSALG